MSNAAKESAEGSLVDNTEVDHKSETEVVNSTTKYKTDLDMKSEMKTVRNSDICMVEETVVEKRNGKKVECQDKKSLLIKGGKKNLCGK